MEAMKVELSKEITDSIKLEVLNAFQEAKDNAQREKFPLYLSKKQACEYLGITNRTFDEWLETGNIPYKHIGKVYRFNRNDLDKFMATK
ncbi:excisionase family DNA-binding protein [Limosilactobacillus reuteri]|uniref:excisionase family DNA-binding protein n=1 Tax=Limosilactobacillus reuteri TaxID=1598 RepID=UPI001E5DFDF9|nr:excisionase family DNA-binding protein [Limosilactobacillus reuteri]MCC4435861.1 excisionase family DNA-binding protein [Limosilactobacillus reuteri]MCC4438181.1 excisionase family DNA-binding protein [Limosilactobacillus reuteri]MCC4442629.1 excisionase family DNA-binding protein [Limosilactobacillus reuteri]MCC4444249.1 excisionase family DNA-binding protein [Limosilactobacillus reuteri]MCC4445935.1 excisionase family DNA-binding protein [Limosilactobacillus reuteri]